MPNRPIIKAIKRYLNDDTSDYAIMLSGEWGAGKSYFVKKEVMLLSIKLYKATIK